MKNASDPYIDRLPARIPQGKFYRGPEPYGCFNTGHCAILLRPFQGDRFLVGPELATIEARRIAWHSPHKRIFKIDGCKVWAFKARAGAVAKWRELIDKQLGWNAEQAAKHREAATAARSSDPLTAIRGAYALSDFLV